jgi:hypothetical protein
MTRLRRTSLRRELVCDELELAVFRGGQCLDFKAGTTMPKKDRGQVTESPDPRATLWFCSQCDAVVGIYSVEEIDLPACPICHVLIMDSLGSFESIVGMALP